MSRGEIRASFEAASATAAEILADGDGRRAGDAKCRLARRSRQRFRHASGEHRRHFARGLLDLRCASAPMSPSPPFSLSSPGRAPSFPSLGNMGNILGQSAILGVLALNDDRHRSAEARTS